MTFGVKISIACILYTIIYVGYMLFAQYDIYHVAESIKVIKIAKPYYWSAFYINERIGFILIASFCLGKTESSLQIMILLSFIIGQILLAIFNLAIINADHISFYKYCTSRNLGLSFTSSSIIMITLVLFFYKKK